MSQIDDIERAEMLNLVLLEKDAKKRFEKAREAIPVWEERVELSRQRGRHDLLTKATAKLEEVRQEAASAKLELEHIANEKAVLRGSALMPDSSHQLAQAESLIEDFRAMGVEPETGEIDELVREETADDMLAALKARMRDDS